MTTVTIENLLLVYMSHVKVQYGYVMWAVTAMMRSWMTVTLIAGEPAGIGIVATMKMLE